MTAEVKGNSLVITIPFDKVGKESGSKKSMVHASTNGNVVSSVMINGKPLTIGVNAYTSIK